MSIPYFWFPILLAHSASNVAPEPVSAAAPSWAAAITQRADAGWQLRDLHSSQDAEGVQVSMTMASARRAERLSIRYESGSQTFAEFAREKVDLPTEERHYDNQLALFEELRLGAPVAIDFDCADIYLDFGSRSVSLAEHEFVVSLWSTGRRPGAALSAWLAASLKEGQLVDIRDERFDDGAEVSSELVFVVASAEGVQEMRVQLGPDGAPAHLQLQHAPGNGYWAPHPSGEELQQMAAKASITRLHFAEEDFELAPKLQIEWRGASPLALELSEFEAEADECGC